MPCSASTPCGRQARASIRLPRCWPRSARGSRFPPTTSLWWGGNATQVVGRRSAGAGIAPAQLGPGPGLTKTPTTLAGHAYWTIEDPAARKQQRIQFHKNMAMIGGLLFAVLDQSQARP